MQSYDKEKSPQSYYKIQLRRSYCNNQTHQMDNQNHNIQIRQMGQTARMAQILSLVPAPLQALSQIHHHDGDARDVIPSHYDDSLYFGQY